MAHTSPSFLSVLAIALWPVQGAAQQGPSFDCDDSDTATEFAICASPELSQLEMQMFGAYQGLVNRIGQQEARRLADELLAPRQACEGDSACIEERLLISMEVFNQTGGVETETAAVEPDQPIAAEEEIAITEPSAPAPATEPEMRVATQTPEPIESVPIPPARSIVRPPEDAPRLASTVQPPTSLTPAVEAETDLARTVQVSGSLESVPAPPARSAAEPLDQASAFPSVEPVPSEKLDEALRNVELTSSDAAPATAELAPFDTPMSWAFMGLSREDRAAIQAKLAAAELYGGTGEGSWDRATLEALNVFAAGPEGQAFDMSTPAGAELALDYINSDDFAAAYRFAFEEAPEAGPTGEPIQQETNVIGTTSSAEPVPQAEPLAGVQW